MRSFSSQRVSKAACEFVLKCVSECELQMVKMIVKNKRLLERLGEQKRAEGLCETWWFMCKYAWRNRECERACEHEQLKAGCENE